MSKNDDRQQSKSTGAEGYPADDGWNDLHMLTGVKERDPKSLARFFDLTFPYVYNLAYRLMSNRETAEDIAQDVFLKVYGAVERLDATRHPKPWLTTITYNACRDVARRAAARPETLMEPLKMSEMLSAGGTPENGMVRREREQLMERALTELDEESRMVVVLSDYCEHSHGEIATIVGASHAAVRKRYSRALKQMAKLIRGYYKG